jgi:hypothetical protein
MMATRVEGGGRGFHLAINLDVALLQLGAELSVQFELYLATKALTPA